MQTYLFYDIETTGLNKSFDQVLHFAAIRTDLAFQELDRYEIKIKLNPDLIPSPGAMITHHMRLADIAAGVSEYEGIKKIHTWLNMPGTISLGYNTLSFDDEFLRFSFYRNLLPAYTHQWANQCARMDIYPMTVMYFLFKNEILKWPTKEGKLSFKLEELNRENQFCVGRAHHAMVDVEATLALAKQLASAGEMWNFLSKYFNKKQEEDFLQKFEGDEALMVLGKFGTEKKFQSRVLALGEHYIYKKNFLWLRLDDADFSQATAETILSIARVDKKKLGEPPFLLPLKDRFLQHVSPERQQLAESNKRWLIENPALLDLISKHHRQFTFPNLPETDIEASLYLNGFWSTQDDLLCKKFHAAPPVEKIKVLESMDNPKLYTLALRIMSRNFPELLTEKHQLAYASYLESAHSTDKPIFDFKGKQRLTPAAAMTEIALLRETRELDQEQVELLNELQEMLSLRMGS